MEIYVGTSGWLYDWNEGASLDWYVEESGLNAVELNASFYRFPFRSQVKSWSIKGSKLKWSVKVHRSITHMRRLGKKSTEIWQKFYEAFKEMDNLIDFYLFQLPPNYACREESLERISQFNQKTKLGLKMAVEFRHASCFNEGVAKWAEKNSIAVVSIDAPIDTWISPARGVIYLRMHGREAWYGYEYSEDELKDMARKIAEHAPRKAYVFFNNNHWMLSNARYMRAALEALV
ncbi:MAG: DUF72 domain-containing protein [Desulfurococcaceae archaeon]